MTEIYLIIKYFRTIFIFNKDIYNSKTIVIIFNLIYNNFNIKTFSFFILNNKLINKSKQILYLTKIKNNNK